MRGVAVRLPALTSTARQPHCASGTVALRSPFTRTLRPLSTCPSHPLLISTAHLDGITRPVTRDDLEDEEEQPHHSSSAQKAHAHRRSASSPRLSAPPLPQHLTELQLERGIGRLVVGDVVLCAECLRGGVRSMARVVGRVDVEEVLEVIFADFCIGK